MKSAASSIDRPNDGPVIVGTARLVRHAYAGGDLGPLWQKLLARYSADSRDAAAMMDMSVILQVAGHREKALKMQQDALRIERCFTQPIAPAEGLRVLVFMTAGDLMANTPVDFLLEGADATLLLLFVDASTEAPHDIPDHDVAFIAIGESMENRPILEKLRHLLAGWKRPILNNAPERIVALTRDAVAATFAGEPTVVAPPTLRVGREALHRLAAGESEGAAGLPSIGFPLIVRPIGSHAGQGAERIDSPDALLAYLAERPEQDFYISAFIDYASPDGLFRKQRIAFIEGKPYASHLAVSEHWMVHYLSARMAEEPERRAAEAAWMESFDADFAIRHAAAFEAINRRIGLDYFGIDCAEMPDGRLLLFEADTAMIVHAMDPEDLFPYKKPAMRKLFAAFQAALQRSAAQPRN
jgi:hypothetical protein